MNDSGLIPLEFFVVVEIDQQDEKTKGGIILPPQVSDKDKLATQEGTLVAASPHAFTYADWQADMRKPQIGERVLFKRFSGSLHERDGRTYRLLNDKDLVAILEDAA